MAMFTGVSRALGRTRRRLFSSVRQTVRRLTRDDVLADFCFLAGAGAIVAGCWTIAEALGLLSLGVFLFAAGIALTLRHGPH